MESRFSFMVEGRSTGEHEEVSGVICIRFGVEVEEKSHDQCTFGFYRESYGGCYGGCWGRVLEETERT